MEYTLQVIAPVNVPIISVTPVSNNYGNVKVKGQRRFRLWLKIAARPISQ